MNPNESPKKEKKSKKKSMRKCIKLISLIVGAILRKVWLFFSYIYLSTIIPKKKKKTWQLIHNVTKHTPFDL